MRGSSNEASKQSQGRWERVGKAGRGQAAWVGWGVKAGCLETEDSMMRDREMGRKE